MLATLCLILFLQSKKGTLRIFDYYLFIKNHGTWFARKNSSIVTEFDKSDQTIQYSNCFLSRNISLLRTEERKLFYHQKNHRMRFCIPDLNVLLQITSQRIFLFHQEILQL